ncbi:MULTISPECIES: hypothetical protein [Mycolicibacterium]|uniref:Putative regulator component n=1 Tax=Mycolicibacterium senegalense TaxID=1796 RepID=A0A378W8Y8_9MYCO|nr:MULTISPECIES: hypothetical protein [Mycolicibacterium]MCV7336952.1 hypothetical protein [Mycolicibacterium senegalense]MDR7287541.1 hypothetical protein [Mycolicibacterium senegalense]QZA24586.1 hypothetical protein K3U95_00170 [Mycolicibacterium senegalense]CDP87222.1 hypothetical protein BN975_03248 [Mycolicibacterium farcinogenes]SUA28882.1 putative regulator component [Mycolicibacterium senegalense]
MVLSDIDMLELIRTLPIPVPWDREAFVQAIADMRGRPITVIATETAFLSHSLCGVWLEREHDDVILHERDASDFRVHQVVCHQIGHMVLGHHSSGARSYVCDMLVESALRHALPDLAPELVKTAPGSNDYGDEQEHEADLFALLLMNAAEGEEHSMIRDTPNSSTASRWQQRARACAPSSTEDADLALVRGYARELRSACDDLRDEPFNREAREHLIRLVMQDSKTADEANQRLRAGFARGQ